jgi:UDP-N-acetylglucosamine 2-epimerase (non-hydrolysing)
LFIPSRDAGENLVAEGIAADRVHFVGNVMIDTLCWALPQAQALDVPARHGVADHPYAVVTLHRPANVDDPDVLRELLAALEGLGTRLPVLFPVHPRTRGRMEALGCRPGAGGLQFLSPLGYLEMLGLVSAAQLVITDSGGLQEETSFLGVPCLTVRPNTERPITCLHGTNRLVQPRRDALLAAAERALARRSPARPVIERWDGKTAERIVRVICEGERLDEAPAGPSAPAAREAGAFPVPIGVA